MSSGSRGPYLHLAAEDQAHLIYAIKVMAFQVLCMVYPMQIVREGTTDSRVWINASEQEGYIEATFQVDNLYLANPSLTLEVEVGIAVQFGRLMDGYRFQNVEYQ